MNRTGILSIGGNGLVGSRISELLSSTYQITNVGSSEGVDITDETSVNKAIQDTDASIILLLAAKADVDGCEIDKTAGKEGAAWKLNVDGPGFVAQACKKYGKKMIFVSTDFVFDGEKPQGEMYTELDIPQPVNWYGKTKYEGELMVQNVGGEFCIVRPAYPYRALFEKKKDFVRAIMGRLEQGLPIKAIADHLFTPTFIDDFALSLDAVIKHNAQGIYHTVGSQTVTPYEAAVQIAETFGYDISLISQTTREEYFAGKATRPFNLSMNNAKITELHVSMRSFKEGLEAMKEQL